MSGLPADAGRADEMDLLTVPGACGIEVRLRRSARSRRLSLRVGRSDGRVTLTMPPRTPLAVARAFVSAQADWIERHVSAVPAQRRVHVGGTVPLMGREADIVPGRGRSARLVGGTVSVADDARASARVRALLTTLARSHLAAAVDHHSEMLGRVPTKLTLRDTRSRWGSCSSRGELMFSWRLIMAPPEVLDYVVAHEVAHLAHMDHSARFWAQVGVLLPDYAERRDWLRQHGAGLHAVDFDAP